MTQACSDDEETGCSIVAVFLPCIQWLALVCSSSQFLHIQGTVPLLLFLNVDVLHLWTNRRHLAVTFCNLTHGECSSLCFQHSQGSSAFIIRLLPLLL